MKFLKLFETFEKDDELVVEQVNYIKKRCLEHLDVLYSLLEKLQYDFSYLPNAKNLKKNKADLIEMLNNSEGLVDGAGLTALWFNDSYYLYVMPVEVAEENDFATESDNEVKADIDKDECIVLVMV